MPMELSLAWVRQMLDSHWQPLFLGSFVVGIVVAILGYVATQSYWRWWVGRSWRKRQMDRR